VILPTIEGQVRFFAVIQKRPCASRQSMETPQCKVQIPFQRKGRMTNYATQGAEIGGFLCNESRIR
jgi:hypothetical protein